MAASVEDIDDLRGWLDVVSALNEVRTVEGADWNLEIGAVSEANYRRTSPPALLFDKIPGYTPGLRVLTGSTANARRLGITMRLGKDCTDRQLIHELRDGPARWTDEAAKYPAQVVDRGPVCDNILSEVDLLDFPVPHWHTG